MGEGGIIPMILMIVAIYPPLLVGGKVCHFNSYHIQNRQ